MVGQLKFGRIMPIVKHPSRALCIIFLAHFFQNYLQFSCVILVVATELELFIIKCFLDSHHVLEQAQNIGHRPHF